MLSLVAEPRSPRIVISDFFDPDRANWGLNVTVMVFAAPVLATFCSIFLIGKLAEEEILRGHSCPSFGWTVAVDSA